MKLFAAILICKILHFIGSRVGKGSSLPGKVALKLCPEALLGLDLPEVIVAVTGSNGKTTTSELIAYAHSSGGKNVAYNREGSNQTEGIATLLLKNSDFRGRVKRDALVLECDERYAAAIFKQVKPSALVVTNLCRDQLTRNGHYEFVADCLREAIGVAGEGTKLVLNADDPYVAGLGKKNKDSKDILWFGVGKEAAAREWSAGTYDDGAFCPCCKARMEYDYRIAAHFGAFRCGACGFSHADVTPELLLSPVAGDLNKAYNLAAAVAGAAAAGLSPTTLRKRLEGYEPRGGRTMRFAVSDRNITLLICKHENSLAYNNAFEKIARQGEECSVIIIVNSISRKYYTSETSWLWDIDVDLLADDCIKEIILAGRYAGELRMRFAMSGVDGAKIKAVSELGQLRTQVMSCSTKKLYALTCFADKARLLKELETGRTQGDGSLVSSNATQGNR